MTNEYKKRLEQGLQYQDFAVNELYKNGIPIVAFGSKKYQIEIGENKSGFEIKNDTLFSKTGNFYIEYQEKSDGRNPNYVDSGILRKDNSWIWVIGDYNDIYIFSKKQLLFLYENINRLELRETKTPTSKGFLLPVNYRNGMFILKHIVVQMVW